MRGKQPKEVTNQLQLEEIPMPQNSRVNFKSFETTFNNHFFFFSVCSISYFCMVGFFLPFFHFVCTHIILKYYIHTTRRSASCGVGGEKTVVRTDNF